MPEPWPKLPAGISASVAQTSPMKRASGNDPRRLKSDMAVLPSMFDAVLCGVFFSTPAVLAFQLPQLEALNLAGRGARQVAPHIDPAWIFLEPRAFLDVHPERLQQALVRRKSIAQ